MDLGRNDIKAKIKNYAREEKERIEKERGPRKYPVGMNWGINRRLEEHWEGGEGNTEQVEGRNEETGGKGGGRWGWVFGGNLRSTTRGTERGERKRERRADRSVPGQRWGKRGGSAPPKPQTAPTLQPTLSPPP